MPCLTEECRKRYCCLQKKKSKSREGLEAIKIDGEPQEIVPRPSASENLDSQQDFQEVQILSKRN